MRRADIWALGMILFELLTGRPAFQADSMMELVVKVTNDPTPPIRTLRPDVPAGLEAVILKCLEKDRNQRYPNVAELALALLPFAPKRARVSVERISGIIQAAGLSISAIAMPPTPQADGTALSAGTGVPVSSTAPGIPGLAPRRSAAVAMALVGIVVIVGGVFAVRAVLGGRQAPAAAAVGLVSPVSPVAVAAPPTTPPSATVEPSASAMAAASSLPSPSASVAAETAATPTTPSRTEAPSRPSSRGVAALPAPATAQKTRPAASSSNCDPPYTVDNQGHKVFKPECF